MDVALTVINTTKALNFAATSCATPICVVCGTLVETPQGYSAVEYIAIGNAVITRDHGGQIVQWIGARSFAAQGSCAPVHFDTDALGNTVPLLVSQQHRVLIEVW